MKVLLLTHRYSGSDGHSTVINNVALALIKKNIHVVIASYNFIKDPPEIIPKLDLSLKDILYFKKISKQFDIIHNFQTLMNYVSIFSSSPFLFHYLGSGTLLQSINLKFSSYITNKNIEKYFVSSSVSANELYKITHKISDIVPLAISDIFFKNINKINKKGNPQLLTITRFMDYKKNEDLLFAFKHLLVKFPNANLQIIGQGPKINQIKNLIDREKLMPNVELLGLIDHESLQENYNSCDLYISTSSKEAFPLPVLECMAVGKPMILSDIAIHKEIIQQSNGGLNYAGGDSADLFNKIMDVLKDYDKFNGVGKSYAKKWNLDNLGNRLLELYGQLP
jgi:glycosyltransferase involved in cell wall biosynthesis